MPQGSNLRPRPALNKAERRLLGKVRKHYKAELDKAQEVRVHILNLTAGLTRTPIVEHLVAEGHNEPALLLTLNNDQLALLLAYKEMKARE